MFVYELTFCVRVGLYTTRFVYELTVNRKDAAISTMEELENVKESSKLTSEESSKPTSESYGSSSLDSDEFTPKSTSDWDSHFVDKLGVESTEAGIIDIILKEWHVAVVPPSEIKEIEATVEACLIEDLDKAFENMTVSEFNRDKFGLNPSEMAKIDNKHPHLKKTFVPNIVHFTFALERIFIDCLAKREISEGKYELLFENLLKSFGLFTLNHSHIGVEKSMIRGKTMSSKADILCIRRKPLMEKEIILNLVMPRKKNWRVAVAKMGNQSRARSDNRLVDTSHNASTSSELDKVLFAGDDLFRIYGTLTHVDWDQSCQSNNLKEGVELLFARYNKGLPLRNDQE
ncbi:uncharacterized protein LOC134234807 [Saccostrea cucullata]|uniref:uncharacterized protein LOC134234807 n=1 Tax=Saccostrea cuccullata TaxID=36930 RepID=UPI002ED530DC